MQTLPRARRAALHIRVVLASATGCLAAGAAWASGPMVTGGLTSQPIGHYEFCKANPTDCSMRPRDKGPEHMTGALWSQIVGVNTSVNETVKPMNDVDIYGKDEVWAYPDKGVGDCEDYVLDKRRELQTRGLSLSNLLVTVVRKPDGEGHAVLTVRTDKGDFVLDNLTNSVRDWSQTGYRFLKRQATNNTGRWVTIREDAPTLVGAVQ
jgi:predicted transglutaminase-like cysteine proteinase